MPVDDALLEKLSHLSMLSFDDAGKEAIRKDLDKMIGFMDKIRELDLRGVEPLLHIGAGENHLRDDVPDNIISRVQALQNAPVHDGRFFIVPRVIQKPGK